jgi:heptosyltransferase I
MRVLIIKMSSMGDVLHTLPALTDAKNNIQNIVFDWLVEPGFSEIPSWHPMVENIIPLPIRNWNSKGILQAIKQMRYRKYDLVIDAQGLCKSAIMSMLAKSKSTAGLNKFSAREPIASYFYVNKIETSWEKHAVTRIRELFASSLGYAIPNTVADYGIKLKNLELPSEYVVETPYVMLLHGTTWETKHWPEKYWIDLALKLQSHGLYTCATWSNDEQLLRVQKIAAQVTNFKILPRVNLNQAAIILKQAKAAVAVDTGFGHLAAALETPLVSIYGATDPIKIGTVGKNQIHLTAKHPCSPCESKACKQNTQGLTLLPPCMATVTPEQVISMLGIQNTYAEQRG